MKTIYFLLGTALLISACKSSTSEGSQSDESNEQAEVIRAEAVCISNGVPVREEPFRKAAYITSLNLGETLFYLGQSIVDTNDNRYEFYQVELSDGKVAWARTYGILIDAKPAAIVSGTPIYKRPDLVTKTDKEFIPVEFIAVVAEKEEWVEVIGNGKKKKGWIKKEKITLQQEDVATATLASKQLITDGEMNVEYIPDFLEELPYENTQFALYLQSILDQQVGAAVEEVIEEYEMLEEELYE
ncbi:MAG TPA: hypothetical protein DDX98_12770 [Bacteroidales bacterium]|jgi:hypothetical protein|nr:hypothetical protein [Bacteroidales bacterium]